MLMKWTRLIDLLQTFDEKQANMALEPDGIWQELALKTTWSRGSSFDSIRLEQSSSCLYGCANNDILLRRHTQHPYLVKS